MFARAGKITAILIMFASFGIWGYAFSGAADRDPPDLLDDSSWSVKAEALCVKAVADVANMPRAADAADSTERSSQIVAATARFEEMLADLNQLPATTDRDAQISGDWLSDWNVLIDDRLRYANNIIDNPDLPFTITDTGVSERLDKRITRFANTNEMYSCVAPTDV